MDRRRQWHVVLPVKGGPEAKSRLVSNVDRESLALAIALDCLEAARASTGVGSVAVVTADPDVATAVRAAGADVVPQAGEGLLAAIRSGLGSAPPGPVAVLLADLPCLRPVDLYTALAAVDAALDGGAGSAFVPDAEGTGTVLLAASNAAGLLPAFGGASASAHERGGAVRLDLDLPRLRRDVDTADALAVAVALGVGPRTRRRLALVQATVFTFDRTARAGTVVTDDGVRLAMPADALDGSGLRHLRVGQRVTCERDGDTVRRVRIVGIEV